jgi:hypothetical protein
MNDNQNVALRQHHLHLDRPIRLDYSRSDRYRFYSTRKDDAASIRYTPARQVHPKSRQGQLLNPVRSDRDELTCQKKDLAYHLTEHLRVNGVYWGLTALCIMGHKDALPREEMVEYVLSCWDDEAGMYRAHFCVWVSPSI